MKFTLRLSQVRCSGVMQWWACSSLICLQKQVACESYARIVQLLVLFSPTRSHFCWQGRIKGGGNGGNCPGPSAPRGPPWWHLFVLNKVFVWKIVVIQKRRKNTNSIFRCCLSIINEFSASLISSRFSSVITTEYKYFRFCSMQIYLNFSCNFS